MRPDLAALRGQIVFPRRGWAICNTECIIFAARSLTSEEIRGKRIIEIGSKDVNGGLRSILEAWGSQEYIGTDIVEGPGVDVICDGENLVARFGENSFDVVVSTEVLEHVRNWRKVISNMKRLCKPGGIVLITTRSIGFPYHSYPHDFWRFELADIREIFSDCEIRKLEKESTGLGVYAKVRKPEMFVERDLLPISLHSIVVNRRVEDITVDDFQNFYYWRCVLTERLRCYWRGILETARKSYRAVLRV
jgi:SAM-dependent methyltransferase